jgi:hypothetical protein
MAEEENPYYVEIVKHDETLTLTPTGRTVPQTVVIFRVGGKGTYPLVYAGKANSAQIIEDITAKVNELRARDKALRDLNAQLQGS